MQLDELFLKRRFVRNYQDCSVSLGVVREIINEITLVPED